MNILRRLLASLVPALAILATGDGAMGQDVEMLSRHYGTPVPRAYFEALASDPDAFQFSHGRPLMMRQRMAAQAGAVRTGAALSLGPRDGPVEGTFTMPVLLGLFADTQPRPPFDQESVHERFFGADGRTVRTYYEEVSRGRVTLRGDITPWTTGVDPQHTRSWVTNGSSGLTARTALWIKGLLAATDGIDWGLYDNDGPDGIPNSGDDDGFVDALAVMHPTAGGECRTAGSEDRIWSHKWSLRSPTGSAHTTASPSANGGFIQVDDYFVVGVLSCASEGLNEIGVFTHEAGHAFGLPDLYDTGGGPKHQGAGNWDLMATGSWGCDNRAPDVPCHMSAWSKMMLGWVDVVEVPAGSALTDITLPPVESSGTIYKVDASDGSGEYYLLENRQPIGFDEHLPASGLLVWQIDPDWVATRWPANAVNAGAHMGVWLRQADGRDDLGQANGNRGDAGDPFPAFGNDRFHAASTPGSLAFGGSATGVTLLEVARAGQDVTFGLLNRLTRVTLRTEGSSGDADLFSVDGRAQSGEVLTFESAAFQPRSLAAAAGAPVGPGVRTSFQEWVGLPGTPRALDLTTPLADTALVARFAGRQVELAVAMTGGLTGITPGAFVTVPSSEDLWFAEGAEVTVEARPVTGFGFREWTGALAGQPNPARTVMDAPRGAGATFEVTYAVASSEHALEAATRPDLRLQVSNANEPVTWRRVDGRLPEGLLLETDGRLSGVVLEVGAFAVTVEARDAVGLTDQAVVTFDVRAPDLSIGALAAPFLLSGEQLTLEQKAYVDAAGNGNGVYDLGDLRAWIMAHPELPMSAAVRALVAQQPPSSGREGGS